MSVSRSARLPPLVAYALARALSGARAAIGLCGVFAVGLLIALFAKASAATALSALCGAAFPIVLIADHGVLVPIADVGLIVVTVFASATLGLCAFLAWRSLGSLRRLWAMLIDAPDQLVVVSCDRRVLVFAFPDGKRVSLSCNADPRAVRGELDAHLDDWQHRAGKRRLFGKRARRMDV